MKHARALRLPALGLALVLLLSPAARALTTDQARELLEKYYIDDIPASVLEQPTIQEMLDALGDPYTEYFNAEEYALFNSTMSDSQLVGIGILSQVTDQGLVIQRVYEDTPAQAGGLQAGDVIVAVDGKAAAGQDGDTVSGWLRGEPGTTVEVSILRDGTEHTFTLTRQDITIPATYSELWQGTSATWTATASGTRPWATSWTGWRPTGTWPTTGSWTCGATAAGGWMPPPLPWPASPARG